MESTRITAGNEQDISRNAVDLTQPSQTATSASSLSRKRQWQPEWRQLLFDAAIQQKELGKMTNAGKFKTEAMTEIVKTLNMAGFGREFDRKAVLERLGYCRHLLRDWTIHIQHTSGWGCNEEGVPINDHDAEAQHFSKHKSCRPFQSKLPPDYHRLQELFGDNAMASGQYARGDLDELTLSSAEDETEVMDIQSDDSDTNSERRDGSVSLMASVDTRRSSSSRGRMTSRGGRYSRAGSQQIPMDIGVSPNELKAMAKHSKRALYLLEEFVSKKQKDGPNAQRKQVMDWIQEDAWFQGLSDADSSKVLLQISKSDGLCATVLGCKTDARKRNLIKESAGLSWNMQRVWPEYQQRLVRTPEQLPGIPTPSSIPISHDLLGPRCQSTPWIEPQQSSWPEPSLVMLPVRSDPNEPTDITESATNLPRNMLENLQVAKSQGPEAAPVQSSHIAVARSEREHSIQKLPFQAVPCTDRTEVVRDIRKEIEKGSNLGITARGPATRAQLRSDESNNRVISTRAGRVQKPSRKQAESIRK